MTTPDRNGGVGKHRHRRSNERSKIKIQAPRTNKSSQTAKMKLKVASASQTEAQKNARREWRANARIDGFRQASEDAAMENRDEQRAAMGIPAR